MTYIEVVCYLMLMCPSYKHVGTGLATWYGDYHHGRTQANGKPFNMYSNTLASRKIPLGRWVRVSWNGYSVWCKSTDRGPYGAILESGKRVQRMHYKKEEGWITKDFQSDEWTEWEEKPGKYRGLTDLSYGCMFSLTGQAKPPNVTVTLEVMK